MTFTKRAAEIFAPVDGGGAPRGASMEDAKTWGTELEEKLGASGLAIFTDPYFGGVADFDGATGTDNLAAWNAFLSYCQANGVLGYVPPGSYYFSGTPASLGNGTILIGGQDYEARFYCNGTSNQFFKVVHTDAYARTVFKGISLIAWNASGPCNEVFHIEYPSTVSFARQMVDIDVMAFGDDSSTSAPFAKHWNNFATLKNLWYPRIAGFFSGKPDILSGADLVGRQDDSWIFRIQGGSYGCIAPDFSNFVGYYAHHAVLADAYMESPRFAGGEFVSVTKGITVPSTTPVGGAGGIYRSGYLFFGADFHIASFEHCLDLDKVQGASGIANLSRSSGSDFAGPWYALKGTDCDGFNALTLDIDGNSGTGDAVGVYLHGGSGHDIQISTENLDKEFDLTATYSKILGNSRASNDTAFEVSNSTEGSTVIEWSLSDGTKVVNGVRMSDALNGFNGVAPYVAGGAATEMVVSSQGQDSVTLRSKIGAETLFEAEPGEATTVNYLKSIAYNTGNNCELAAAGSDTNIGIRIRPKGSGTLLFEWLQSTTSYANDAAAAAGGVPIGGVYRNGSTISIRIS